MPGPFVRTILRTLAEPFARHHMGSSLCSRLLLCASIGLLCNVTSAQDTPGISSSSKAFPTPTIEAPEPPVVRGTRVRFGVLQFESASSYRKDLDNVQESLVKYLQATTPQLTIEAVPFHSSAELKEAIRRHEVEFFLASSGLYVEVQPYGARDIGTLVAPEMPDPNQCVAGVMVVRSDRNAPVKLEDLAGLRAVSTAPENFMTFQTNMATIARAGFNPETFFRSVSFTSNDPEKVLEDVIEGRADVGLLRACMPEALERRNPALVGKWQAVNLQSAPAGKRLGCAYSTPLYPGWTIAVANHTPAAITRYLAVALLRLSPSDTPGGYTVSFATNYEGVSEVFRLLLIGPYEYLRHWTVQRVFETYWPIFVLVLEALLFWAWLSWRLGRLVVRRTAALEASMHREREANEAARVAAEKLNQWERVGMIGKLSSVFAHEFVQPLTAMRYHARSIRKLLEKDPVNKPLLLKCIDGLSEQLTLAGNIIDRVRSYAKGGAKRNDRLDLHALAEEVVREMGQSKKILSNVCVRIPKHKVFVEGNAVELRVLIMNLLKNADEALRSSGASSPITLEISEAESFVRLSVENAGRRLSENELERIQTPLASTKEGGLGLGLLLCKSIAEVHRARITFEAPEKGGLVVTVEFRSLPSHESVPPAPLSNDADSILNKQS